MPTEINPDHYQSLLQIFEEAFQAHGSKPAFENMGKVLTFAEIDSLSARFASFIQQKTSLKPGDRLAIQMPNCLQYPIVFIGALRAGLIVVNTNPLYTPREMEYQFKDSGAKGIVIIANFAANLEKIIGQTKIETVIVTELGDLLGGLKKHLVNFVVKRVKKMVPSYHLPHAIPFAKTLKGNTPHQIAKSQKEDTILLQYTGGTTGLSKGACLTHRNLTSNLLQSSSLLRLVFPPQSVAIVPLPLYHITALHGALVFMMLGYKSVLITNPKDIPGFIKTLKSQPFHILIGVNTLFNALANHSDINQVDFSNLKASIGGGMAIQEAVSEKWKALTGHHITQGYGLSETSPMLTINIPGKDRPGYIGVPFPNTDIMIADDNGNPEADGYFKIVDRKKDMILVSGFNVYPNEVEAIVAMHPKVLEAAAIGVPDEHSTEAVKLFVIKKDNSLTSEELFAFCKENMVNYKRPKYIEFREELPKSNVGKILRRALRDA